MRTSPQAISLMRFKDIVAGAYEVLKVTEEGLNDDLTPNQHTEVEFQRIKNAVIRMNDAGAIFLKEQEKYLIRDEEMKEHFSHDIIKEIDNRHHLI